MRIHHVQLLCPPGCEPAARDFYGGVLGLDELPKPPTLAVRGGGIELHVSVDTEFRPARKAHPGLLWPDLDRLAARLDEAGALGHRLPGYAPVLHRRPVREPTGVPRTRWVIGIAEQANGGLRPVPASAAG
jgi:catechol 2,3-dioxygenase-like lactoylglutathione lyase family enzyme